MAGHWVSRLSASCWYMCETLCTQKKNLDGAFSLLIKLNSWDVTQGRTLTFWFCFMLLFWFEFLLCFVSGVCSKLLCKQMLYNRNCRLSSPQASANSRRRKTSWVGLSQWLHALREAVQKDLEVVSPFFQPLSEAQDLSWGSLWGLGMGWVLLPSVRVSHMLGVKGSESKSHLGSLVGSRYPSNTSISFNLHGHRNLHKRLKSKEMTKAWYFVLLDSKE